MGECVDVEGVWMWDVGWYVDVIVGWMVEKKTRWLPEVSI